MGLVGRVAIHVCPKVVGEVYSSPEVSNAPQTNQIHPYRAITVRIFVDYALRLGRLLITPYEVFRRRVFSVCFRCNSSMGATGTIVPPF